MRLQLRFYRDILPMRSVPMKNTKDTVNLSGLPMEAYEYAIELPAGGSAPASITINHVLASDLGWDRTDITMKALVAAYKPDGVEVQELKSVTGFFSDLTLVGTYALENRLFSGGVQKLEFMVRSHAEIEKGLSFVLNGSVDFSRVVDGETVKTNHRAGLDF